ncbi:MAG: LamB/YcsF family protein [Gemmatimonadetes bacterium]|nr:LamB/YcsF family protein [Gemmatimonadota bacterium]
MTTIDLNCDVGEGAGYDAEILEHVSSASIACGGHAGDAATMRATVTLAVARGVAVGAHPGMADPEGFGRRAVEVTPEEAYRLVREQVTALAEVATACGSTLSHVKPHGALYNLAATDAAVAEAVARAVHDLDARLVLFGLSGGCLLAAGERVGLRTASEVFADRGYRTDGTLVPRAAPGALVTDPAEAVRRTLRMARAGKVETVDGGEVEVRVDTICIHGDTPGVVYLAWSVHRALVSEGFAICPVRGAL